MGNERVRPGPDCLESRPIKQGDHVMVIDRRGEPEFDTTVASVGQHFVEVPSPTRPGFIWLVDPKRVVPIRQVADLRRIEAIGRARVQAHRRHLRYRSWLLSMGWRDVAMVRASEEARAYLSPEAHVLAAAADGRMWPFRAVGEPWLERAWSATCYHEAARAMVGSGEYRRRGPSAAWSKLPWQQEPKETHG